MTHLLCFGGPISLFRSITATADRSFTLSFFSHEETNSAAAGYVGPDDLVQQTR